MSLLNFSFYDLSIAESGVLKSFTIIVWGEMCVWVLVKFLLCIWMLLNLEHKCSELGVHLGRFFL